jgi:hypothetical protein
VKRDEHARGVALLHFLGIGLTDTQTQFLMAEVLRLPLSYFGAVQQVVAEGRWRTAKNPLAYVRIAAWRTGIADAKWNQPDGLPVPANMSHDKFIDLQASGYGPVKKDGVWRVHSFYDDDDDYWQDGLRPGERLRNRVPEQFCRYWPNPEERAELERMRFPIPVDPIRCPDWDAIAKAAGLDPGEAEVLGWKARGLSRDTTLKFYGTDAKRKQQIQAAWRRFDRNRGLERVAEVLTGGNFFLV